MESYCFGRKRVLLVGTSDEIFRRFVSFDSDIYVFFFCYQVPRGIGSYVIYTFHIIHIHIISQEYFLRGYAKNRWNTTTLRQAQ